MYASTIDFSLIGTRTCLFLVKFLTNNCKTDIKLSKKFPKRIALSHGDYVGLMCGQLKENVKVQTPLAIDTIYSLTALNNIVDDLSSVSEERCEEIKMEIKTAIVLEIIRYITK